MRVRSSAHSIPAPVVAALRLRRTYASSRVENLSHLPLLELQSVQQPPRLIRRIPVHPTSFLEGIEEHRFRGGRTLRPVAQSSREAVLRAQSGGRLDVQAVDTHGGTSRESVLLHLLVGPHDDAFNLDVEFQFGGVRRDERDRALGIASEFVLQHGDGPWSADLAHRNRI